MARSRRPRRPAAADDNFDRFLQGARRTERRRGSEWNVQPVSGSHAVKSYTCPGCSAVIEVGTPHIVAWRADGVLGDAADLADRRHWHSACWRIG